MCMYKTLVVVGVTQNFRVVQEGVWGVTPSLGS